MEPKPLKRIEIYGYWQIPMFSRLGMIPEIRGKRLFMVMA